MSMEAKLQFQVEIKRVLDILSKEIYDSPYALLRENIQNAFDAILMRHAFQGGNWSLADGHIDVTITDRELIISDNGIGMTREVLENHYWKAGSTGKKNELAQKAGVVGTFGIGAMANFGVCTHLEVTTRAVDSEETLVSFVDRSNLSLTEPCIMLETLQDERPYGTTICAQLEVGHSLLVHQAIQYLMPYVRYIPIKLTINNEIISCHQYDLEYTLTKADIQKSVAVNNGAFSFNLLIEINKQGHIAVRATSIQMQGQPIQGDIALLQGSGQIMGLRSSFGLAYVPIGQHYGFGGVVNLSILHPTAGREALSRESIEIVNQLVMLIEKTVTEVLSELDVCDTNNQFLQYIVAHNRFDLAANVKIHIHPDNEMIPMKLIKSAFQDKNIYYFTGVDQRIIDSFSTGKSIICQVSQSNPRRQVQLNYIQNLGIEAVPDQIQVLRTYKASELDYEELALKIRVISVLNDDYLISSAELIFAEISHQVTLHVESSDKGLLIYLARNSDIVRPVLECYKNAYQVFPAFVKDFVRVYIYHRIQHHVPSATREGLDAFHRLMQQRREMYKYETEDIGDIESILSDFIQGDRSFSEVMREAKMLHQSQNDSVNWGQVGSFEEELPDVIHSPVTPEPEQQTQLTTSTYFEASPAILRLESETGMKILTTDREHTQLNNFTKFLALSDRVFNIHQDLFMAPHSTRVIWGSHRVVYMFTLASSDTTFYYDIELREPLDGTIAGGSSFPTTTIVTKNKIFVPIPALIAPSFHINSGTKEFFVRYDIL